MKKLRLSQLVILNACWLGLSFMWNALHPIILPAVLLNYVPDEKKNTYLGLLTFMGLVIAMVVQPLSGAVSDGWKSRFGRRRPLMVFGTLFDFIYLSILAWAGGLAWLFIGYIGLQLSSNIAHGPLQGLLPDTVPQTQLGVASSLKTFMDMLALVAASLLAGRMIDSETRDPTTIMLIVIGLLAISASITIFGVREKPTGEGEHTGWRALSGQFKISFAENSAYWWLIVERALFRPADGGRRASAPGVAAGDGRAVVQRADALHVLGVLLRGVRAAPRARRYGSVRRGPGHGLPTRACLRGMLPGVHRVPGGWSALSRGAVSGPAHGGVLLRATCREHRGSATRAGARCPAPMWRRR